MVSLNCGTAGSLAPLIVVENGCSSYKMEILENMNDQQKQISLADAEKLSALLLECINILNECGKYSRQNCTNEFRSQVEPILATITADIGWDLLERIFHQHPSLRPYKLEINPKAESQGSEL